MIGNLILVIWINEQVNTTILTAILIKKPKNADYSGLTEKIETNTKASIFKVVDRGFEN